MTKSKLEKEKPLQKKPKGMQGTQGTKRHVPEKTTRRRGEALDEAILAAAWSALQENGYINFTLEAVAARAETSRPVLSRRWKSRAELAVAALNHYRQQHPISAPDLGGVREELAVLLQRMAERNVPVVHTVLFSMRDYFEETHSNLNQLRGKLEGSNLIEEVLQRAVARGEVDPAKLTRRIVALPLDLVRHEVFMTNQPITKSAIEEILDTIFLPLVTPSKMLSRRKS